MDRLENSELKEIIESYGFSDLSFERFLQVEPDTALYFFHDKSKKTYCLVVSDYLDDVELPCEFIFEYYRDKSAYFRAVEQFSYLMDAPKKALDFIDEHCYRTTTNVGDVCMLFAIEGLE